MCVNRGGHRLDRFAETAEHQGGRWRVHAGQLAFDPWLDPGTQDAAPLGLKFHP
ncbi:hypothetical protein [Desulfatitalea tepidiphila]|uniref:hypothetical protein n=1 Tax=Desulfatitalea tepidiphila TaxID=1185843 RepID=UPI00137922E3|nr:hypothetical protein [Desulfatitalea tepidiphila]